MVNNLYNLHIIYQQMTISLNKLVIKIGLKIVIFDLYRISANS
jgi:hypothetical protein